MSLVEAPTAYMDTNRKKFEQFKVLLAVALCDDNLHASEISLLNDFATKHNLPIDEHRNVLLEPEKHVPQNYDSVELDFLFLVQLSRMILADSVIEDSELDMLYQFADRSKLAGSNVQGWCHYLLELVDEGLEPDAMRSELDQLHIK